MSIVVYESDLGLLQASLLALDAAAARLHDPSVHVDIVDNGPADYSGALALALAKWRATDLHVIAIDTLSGHGNVGYGAGNNLSIARHAARYHLVLNPDTDLAIDSLSNAVGYMDAHPDVGLLTGATFSPEGSEQNLCKSYPSVLVLGLRALRLRALDRVFRRRLAAYDVTDPRDEADITHKLVSGSFMFFRTTALKAAGAFDPAFFVYFEDFDLSLRISQVARVVRVKSVRLIHHGGGASRKGIRHHWLFASGAWKFFQRHGWRFV